jgi:peptide/nickel transport system substrate-binding protein
VLSGVLSPDAFAFDADLPAYAYDPGKAKQLLAEAGYPGGIEATLDAEAAFKDQAEAVAALLNRAGVRAKVQIWEGAVLTPIWQNAQKRRDRDMVLAGWGNGSLDPSDIMMPTIRSGGRGNLAGYANPEVDRMLDTADVEVDRDKRRGLYMKVQETVNREAPWIFLWLPQEIYGVSKRVKGWQPSADSRINLHRASVE